MLVTSIDGGAVHRIALADDLPAGRASAAVSGAGRHLVLPYQRSDALGTVIGLVDERGPGLDDLLFDLHTYSFTMWTFINFDFSRCFSTRRAYFRSASF
jgi:hypothetical protein